MTTSRDTLKGFFETGDFPTETEFADWLDSVPLWQKTTLGFAAFQPEGTDNKTITIFSGAAGTTPQAVKLKHTTSFTGGALNAADMRILDGNGNQILSFFNVFQAPGATVGTINNTINLAAIPSQAAPSNYEVEFFVGNGVIDDLTAGSVDIWILEGPVT